MIATHRLATAVILAVIPLAAVPGFSPGAVEAAEPETRVPPGGVVRWSGEGTTACVMGSRRWEPVGDTCWYPVDLEREAGSFEAVRWRDGVRETAHVHVTDYPYEVQYIEIEDESKVHLSEEDLARVRRESRKVGALWDRRGPRLFELPLAPPLDPLPDGGRFGARRFFNGEARSPHSGADYGASKGTPVYAVADGVVALAGDHFFSGNSVFIDHGSGLITMYFHLSEIAVEEGERVGRGTVIGEVGSTGRSTAPHLHFGIRWWGERVDPRMLLDPSRAPAVAAAPAGGRR